MIKRKKKQNKGEKKINTRGGKAKRRGLRGEKKKRREKSSEEEKRINE